MKIVDFEGNFALLGLASELRYGSLPGGPFPGGHAFQLAAVTVAHDLEEHVEAHWFLEAVRERILRPGRKLDSAALHEINVRVAARIYEIIQRQKEEECAL